MNSRERVLRAINHQEPDRIPLDLGVGRGCGITVEAYKNLLDYLGLGPRDIKILSRVSQLATVHEDVLQRLGVDVREASVRPPASWTFELEVHGEYLYFKDEWGIGYHMPRRGGRYFDMVEHPLAGAALQDLWRFPWPDPRDPTRFSGLREQAKRLHEEGWAVMIARPPGNGFLQMGAYLMGFEDWYSVLASEPAKAHWIMDKLLEIKVEFWDQVLDLAGEYIDIVCETDDLGMQNAPLISPKMYREYIKPRQQALFSFIKQKADVYVFLHSDGSIYDLLPDIIETGVDIINPVQLSAAKMDPIVLKKEFGKDLTFWGAGVDTQSTLPFKPPEEVRDEVRRNIEVFAPGGGFVFGPVHNIQGDVPPENIIAMWETFMELSEYK